MSFPGRLLLEVVLGGAAVQRNRHGGFDVDAAGLDVLVYACHAATAAHVKLVLCSLPSLVLELLEPTRLSELGDIAIEPTMPIPLHGSAA